MNYEQFKTYVKESLEAVTGEEVEIYPVVKNNSFVRDGLSVCSAEKNTAVPTIYLDGYFRAYEDGTPAPNLVRDMLAFYEEKKRKLAISPDYFSSFARMEPRIVYKLISREKNEGMLAHVPHKDFLDLEMVYYALFMGGETGDATMLVEDSHLRMWGVGTAQVHEAAMRNTPKFLPYTIRAMNEVMEELLMGDLEEGIRRRAKVRGMPEAFSDEDLSRVAGEMLETVRTRQEQIPMYVVSNTRGLYGAASILYEGVLEQCAEVMNGSFYILPSSVHEVLIMPVNGFYTELGLSDMVKEINRTQVAVEEVLSDHVYIYHRKTGKITM